MLGALIALKARAKANEIERASGTYTNGPFKQVADDFSKAEREFSDAAASSMVSTLADVLDPVITPVFEHLINNSYSIGDYDLRKILASLEKPMLTLLYLKAGVKTTESTGAVKLNKWLAIERIGKDVKLYINKGYTYTITYCETGVFRVTHIRAYSRDGVTLYDQSRKGFQGKYFSDFTYSFMMQNDILIPLSELSKWCYANKTELNNRLRQKLNR